MLERLLGSTLAPGSNRRRDVTATSVVALLPELGPGPIEVHGALGPELAAALGAVSLEPTSVAPVQLWVGSSPPAMPMAGLRRGAPPAPIVGSGRGALALALEPRAATERSARARAVRVLGRARRRIVGGAAPADIGERGAGSTLYGIDPDGGAAAGPAVATVVAPGAADLPPWLRRRLRAADIALEGRTWRLLADAEYPSQKLAWFLYGPDGDGVPETVVKLARTADFSPRLHNEHAALSLLARAGSTGAALPRPLLDDEVHGLALVAESGVGGRPFSVAGRTEPGDPVLEAALDAVLAVTCGASALRSTATTDELRRDLGRLAERVPGVDVRPLVADLAEVGSLPTVLQHGDPGTWNLLVAADGTVAVLDWENAEPRGLPVADALFFVAGAARRALEARGRRPTPEAVVGQVLAGGRWADWTRRSLRRAAEGAGCEPASVPALAVLGAAYQAAKEAPRRDPASSAPGEWSRITAVLRAESHRLG
jgi:hypothetical protein